MSKIGAMIVGLIIVPDLCFAQGSPPQMVTPRLRVAVMDLTGSALKMQMAQAPSASGGVTTQTTISIPPPAEFARALTEALTTSLAATGKFIVLERAALQQVQQEQPSEPQRHHRPQGPCWRGRGCSAKQTFYAYFFSSQKLGLGFYTMVVVVRKTDWLRRTTSFQISYRNRSAKKQATK